MDTTITHRFHISRCATNNQSPHQITKLGAVELTKHVMSQLLYPPNTTFNCRSLFFPLKRTKPRFYPLNDSSIQRNDHTPWSIVPMFLNHSKAEKEKHHFVQQKQPPTLHLWSPRGPYSSQRSPFGCKVESKQNSQNPKSWIKSESWGGAR